MQKDIEKLKATKVQVIGISYDKVKVLSRFSQKGKISFPLLSDPKSQVIRAFGIKNEEVANNPFLKGVPYPGTFLLDEKGIIRAKLFLKGYRDRHSTENLLEAAQKIK